MFPHDVTPVIQSLEVGNEHERFFVMNVHPYRGDAYFITTKGLSAANAFVYWVERFADRIQRWQFSNRYTIVEKVTDSTVRRVFDHRDLQVWGNFMMRTLRNVEPTFQSICEQHQLPVEVSNEIRRYLYADVHASMYDKCRDLPLMPIIWEKTGNIDFLSDLKLEDNDSEMTTLVEQWRALKTAKWEKKEAEWNRLVLERMKECAEDDELLTELHIIAKEEDDADRMVDWAREQGMSARAVEMPHAWGIDPPGKKYKVEIWWE